MNILVTGASRGIGLAIAQELCICGNVFVTSRNLKNVPSDFVENCIECDFTKFDDLVNLGNFILSSDIDVLINNAGEYIYSCVEDIKPNDLTTTIDINLKAPIYLSKCAVANMKKKRFGRIINIGSISGVMGESGACVYSATKAGLIGFAKASGLELAPYGITVNTINPGWVDTELGNKSIDECEFSKDEILDCIPQKRFVSPDEVAKLVKYLISDDAKGITGQSINLCAGLSVGY